MGGCLWFMELQAANAAVHRYTCGNIIWDVYRRQIADMRKSASYYYIGLILSIVFLLASELIWLPAPLHTGSGLHWIEMIDWLFYGLALVPLSWAWGAALGLRRSKRQILQTGSGLTDRGAKLRIGRFLSILLRLLIVAAGVVGAGLVLVAPERLELILIVVIAAAVLVLTDLLVIEAVQRQRAGAETDNGLAAEADDKGSFRFWRYFPWTGARSLLLLVVILVVLLYPTGYRVTYPGMTLGMNRYAHAEGGHSGGYIDGVLVFERPAVLADRLLGKLLPIYEFEKIPEGESPFTETYAQVAAMKTDANELAAAVAMGKAGLGTGVTTEGVRIAAIVKDSPAEGRLQAGDIIKQLNEHQVASVAELTGYMGQHIKPGNTVSLAVERGVQRLTIEVPTIASSEEASRPVFGISVQNELHLDVPRKIDYKRYMAHIGGPSHGAMLTLAIIDQLTPGGVTNGWRVAGTGTIEPDGAIGRIGGIKQKAYAVSRTDADVFFVPASQEEEARAGAPQLRIVGVQTIDDVLAWLASHQP
jgi:PDZ domain-containing protein